MRNEKGQFMKGNKPVCGFKKGCPSPKWMLGKKHSEETKRKMSNSHKNLNSPTGFKKGCVSYCKLHPEVMRRGEASPHWIKDRSKLKRYNDENKDRRSSIYNAWRKSVWLRDNFKCKMSNPDCKGRLEAHHILGWKDYPELRYDINNGITLCHFHHPMKKKDEKRLSPYFMELV